MRNTRGNFVSCLLASSLGLHDACAQLNVLTNNYDNNRTGSNLAETSLTPSNVSVNTFGKLLSYTVDGSIEGQVLYVSNVAVSGSTAQRNVILAATMNNSVYAFDADATPGSTAPLWYRNLRTPAGGTGIRSTPVVDLSTKTPTMYVIAIDGSTWRYYLYGIDITSGSVIANTPVNVDVTGTFSTGPNSYQSIEMDNPAGSSSFPNLHRIQRAGLAIAGNKILVAFSSEGDSNYNTGWVVAIDKTTYKVTGYFCTTCATVAMAKSLNPGNPNVVDYLSQIAAQNGQPTPTYAPFPVCLQGGPGGGIWQSGRGPVVDQNGIAYYFVGNRLQYLSLSGSCSAGSISQHCDRAVGQGATSCHGQDTYTGYVTYLGEAFDVQESLIALDPSNSGSNVSQMKLTGWFRPSNWNWSSTSSNLNGPNYGMEYNDLDLSGSGPLLIPGTTSIVGGGKQGVMYTLDTSRLSSSASKTMTNGPQQSFEVAANPNPVTGTSGSDEEYWKHIMAGPVLWNRTSANGGSLLYVWRENDYLRAYRVSAQGLVLNGDGAACATPQTPPDPVTINICASAYQSNVFIDHHPGGILTLSANGQQAHTGIVWALASVNIDRAPANGGVPQASGKGISEVLRVFDASTLTELWNSQVCAADVIRGIAARFAPPTVANGRVYVPTQTSGIIVYGLRKRRSVCNGILPIFNLLH